MHKIFSKINKEKNSNQGFTIVETLVALAIFSSSIVFLIVVSSGGVSNTTLAKSRLTASYLAQEGVEAVRNIRDTSVIADPSGEGWSTFISSTSSCTGTQGCNIDPSSLDICACTGSTCNIPYSEASGYFGYDQSHDSEASGYFGYDQSHACDLPSGSIASPFTRTIFILQIPETAANDVLVTSKVTWYQGVSEQTITYQNILMDWQPHISAI
ncbi:MAG: prepilin-type N-terminal cleavage/methylation domain-containing protein [Candidatus Pacebacteria bacterium]|nr:prepilin-type N-terminal cleavage/methylation domain-containing protein [Candidatus Paceibacterota bacterium]MBP9772967.1 prepilin-type N-terminal cleavage/methylation domain-containing protein [Candidatus Paceibacterota bacterium]